MEFECDTCGASVFIHIHQIRHQWHDGPLAVCWHVLLCVLLAQRRPLHLLYQLHALGRNENVVRCSRI